MLGALSKGQIESGMAEALKMTDRLEAELPQMLAEHKDIVRALQGLVKAARAENMPKYVHFAEKLRAHARTGRRSVLSHGIVDRSIPQSGPAWPEGQGHVMV